MAHKDTATAIYRPLPAIQVAWKATDEDVAAARSSAEARRMPFDAAAADELRTLHTHLAELHRTISVREREQKEVGARIPALRPETSDAAARDALRARARTLRDELRTLHHAALQAHARSIAIRDAWPNRMHPAVPLGAEPEARVVAVCDARADAPALPPLALPCTAAALAEAWGGALPIDPKRDHLHQAELHPHGGVDLAAGITATGPSWPYLIGTLAMLEHALTQYALAAVLQRGFVIASVPDVVKTEVAERCGFRPRDEASAQTYLVDTQRTGDAPLCLAGTAEIPLAAYVAHRTFQPHARGAGGEVGALPLPVKLAALGHAFRAEAGARGTDTRGLYRIHQFSKVEMFVVCEAEASDAMLEELRGVQEALAQGLGLLYRVLDMPSEELGASAARKYDVEAWMPGRGAWGEICSASNCTDYQAHRLAIKYKPRVDDAARRAKLQYAHTLNATAAAIPRLVVALLETYGQRGTQLVLPSTLQAHWLGGRDDPRVCWVHPRTGTRAAAGGAPRAAGLGNGRRLLHTSPSVRRAKTLAAYKDLLRASSARLGARPTALVLAFVVLHELTALVPLLALALVFAALGVGDALLDALDIARTALVPNDAQDAVRRTLHAWIERGTRVAARLCARCDAYLACPTESANAPVAVWLSSLTASYVVVKALFPVRLAACLALAPRFARGVVQPLGRCLRGRRA